VVQTSNKTPRSLAVLANPVESSLAARWAKDDAFSPSGIPQTIKGILENI
jgi:hypothetical protein